MALHVDEAIKEKYHQFYKFALEEVPFALAENVLEINQVTNEELLAKVDSIPYEQQMLITCVVVKDSPQLQSLAPLCAFTNLNSVGIWRCKKLVELWPMESQNLQTLIIVDCKSLKSINAIKGCAQSLQHFFLHGRGWNLPRLETIEPVGALHQIVTCDLGVAKVQTKCTIRYKECFPNLDSLTITPNISKCFNGGN